MDVPWCIMLYLSHVMLTLPVLPLLFSEIKSAEGIIKFKEVFMEFILLIVYCTVCQMDFYIM